MPTKSTQPPYDYKYLLKYITQQGKKIYNRDFLIDDNDKAVIIRLLAYFLKDKDTAGEQGIDLNKGVLLMGPVGCGKTALMKVMISLFSGQDKPLLRSCNEITIDFNTKGFDALYPYCKGAFIPYTSIPRVFCFDDLGLEPMGSYYGSTCNVMAEILLSRYNHFIASRMITHITTNLNSTELEAIYGNRIRSRMREMFNQIIFHSNSTDKRR